MKTLKEKYLVDGNVFELNNGTRYILFNGDLSGLKGWDGRSDYSDDLTSRHNSLTIDKIYKVKGRTGNLTYLLKEDKNLQLIWERKPLPELTDDEKVILRNVEGYYNIYWRYEALFVENKSSFIRLGSFQHLFKTLEEGKVYKISELLGED